MACTACEQKRQARIAAARARLMRQAAKRRQLMASRQTRSVPVLNGFIRKP